MRLPAPAVAAALALLAALAPQTLAAQEQREQVDSVSLRFDWPVGTTALVHQEWSRIQQTSERSDSVLVRSRYRLQVDDHPNGRLVRVDSFALVPGGSAMADDSQQLVASLGSLMPSYVVSSEGEFVALADLPALQAAMDSVFAPMLRELEDASEQARALIDNAISPEALTASAAQQWNLMVGTWVGADWEVGATYGFAAEEPIPVMPGRSIPMNYEFGALERTSCVEGAPDRDCILLVMLSEPDSAAMEQFLQDIFTTIVPGQEDLARALRSTRTTNTVRVVAEPGTLRPHWFEVVRHVEVDAAPSGGEPGGLMIRTDRRTATFRYEER